MTSIAIISEANLRELVPLDYAVIDEMESAFRALATEAVVMPPILRLDLPDKRGEVDVKTAHLPRLESFAVKVSCGFFDNPILGLPSLTGLMLVLSAKTGLVEALLLDNGYLTAIRTAAAGAVAARWLSNVSASRVAVIGAGEQALLQVQALSLVRTIKHVAIWARNLKGAEHLALQLQTLLAIECTIVTRVHDALAGADIAITTTPSSQPLVQASDLHLGLHITAMGSDSPHKNEIAPSALVRTHYICDRLAQARLLGELHHAIIAGEIEENASFGELGEVIAGKAIGRKSASDITICDLTGTGVQDTAIAALALNRARAAKIGTVFSNG